MKNLLAAAVLMIMALPAVCLAAPANPGWYASGFIGVSVPSAQNISGTDFVGNVDFNDRVEFDPGVFIGGTGGYDFGFLRLEGELSYKHTEIKSVRDESTGARFRNMDGNLGVFATLFNGFMDLHNSSPVTPYLGGGIGFATLHLSDTFGTSAGGSRTFLYGDGDDTVFAYQAGAGIEIGLTPRFSLDLGYRYFSTNRADFDSDRDISSSMKFESHNAAMGFRYRF